MTPEDQIKVIAELDGWTDVKFYVLGHKPDGITALARSRSADYRCDLPDYLTSRDAIVPVIEKQSDEVLIDFIRILLEDVLRQPHAGRYTQQLSILLAIPSQLCEALLRATGKWIE